MLAPADGFMARVVAVAQGRDCDLEAALRRLAMEFPDRSGEIDGWLAAAGEPIALDRILASVSATFAAEIDGSTPTARRIGGYRTVRPLGHGCMGIVYEAETDAGRPVALKLVHPGWLAPGGERHFTRRMGALQSLRHDGIAAVYDAGVADLGQGPQPFIIGELVRGTRLGSFATVQGLRPHDRLKVFAGLCLAVQHAHDEGFVHGDLKPANLLVETDGRVKVVDFGLVEALGLDVTCARSLSDPADFVEALAYLSPERVASEVDRADIAAEVYSLGVVLFELITGRLPHSVRGKSVAEAIRIIHDERPLALSDADPVLRCGLEEILAKALSRRPEERYATVADFAAEVERFAREKTMQAGRPGRLYQLRSFASRVVSRWSTHSAKV
ncbi:MAG: serine/threonine-protein kinase [Planctomycetota bacterium]